MLSNDEAWRLVHQILVFFAYGPIIPVDDSLIASATEIEERMDQADSRGKNILEWLGPVGLEVLEECLDFYLGDMHYRNAASTYLGFDTDQVEELYQIISASSDGK